MTKPGDIKVEERSQIKGVLCSGVHQGSYFTELDWVRTQCNSLLGFVPYPGTLNLKVENLDLERWQMIKQAAARLTLSAPTQEFCSAWLFPGSMEESSVAAVVPLVNGYPEDLIELLAPVHLRKQLNIKDGDRVAVTFSLASPRNSERKEP